MMILLTYEPPTEIAQEAAARQQKGRPFATALIRIALGRRRRRFEMKGCARIFNRWLTEAASAHADRSGPLDA
jgi:hypothetical protein